jgi:hypothetical protein
MRITMQGIIAIRRGAAICIRSGTRTNEPTLTLTGPSPTISCSSKRCFQREMVGRGMQLTTSMKLHSGRLYIRTHGALYCFGKP